MGLNGEDEPSANLCICQMALKLPKDLALGVRVKMLISFLEFLTFYKITPMSININHSKSRRLISLGNGIEGIFILCTD